MTNETFTTLKKARHVALMAALCLFAFAFSPTVARAVATDTITITVSVDDAGMVTSDITSPTEGFDYATDSITIEGTAASSNGVVALVQVSIDGGAWHNASAIGANYSTWEYATDTLSTGSHTVTSRAQNVYDSTGAPSTTINFTITIVSDTTPPTTITMVYDGATTSDIAYSTSTAYIIANWSASSDPDTGVARYFFSVGTASGASDTVAWTDNATDTAFTLTGQSLSDGSTYYTSVKAENGVGLFSTPTVSDGFLVDSLAPTITDNQTGDDTIRASASATYDVDASDPGGSGLDYFQARACSTNANCGDLVDWTDVATAIATNAYSVDWALPGAIWDDLQQGTGTNYISVRAFDAAGNTYDEGPLFYVVKDTLPPDFSGVYSATDTMQGGTVELTWDNATNDTSTPFVYNIFYAQTSGGQDFTSAPQATSSATSAYVTGLTDDQSYYFSVRAEDAAGNESTDTTELPAIPTCKSDLSVSVATSSVVSPLGGDPVPGTLVGYIISYSNSPSYCDADAVVLSNNIPADADFYITAGITLDGSSKTIAIDGDACALKSAPDRVECSVATLTAGASGTLEFKVTID